MGYTEEELIDKQISLIIADNKLLQKAIQQRSLYKKYFQNVEVVCRTKSRERKLIAFSCERANPYSIIRKNYEIPQRDFSDKGSILIWSLFQD